VASANSKGDDLKAEIASLPVETLSAALRDAAAQVRLIGNDAAHVREITDKDLNHLLLFTEEILHHLFVLPHRLEEAEKKRKPT